MLASIESFFHRLRRRFSRSEWAVRHFGLTVSEHTEEKPGLLLIQIDGLARRQMEKAMEAGRLPFLRRLMDRECYQLHTLYSGAPSTTPAVQAELYYGVRAGVPAFSYLDRERGEIGSLFNPEWARRLESQFAAESEGLLTGGSSWSNIYRGGAAEEECHFCIASSSRWPKGHPGVWLLFFLMEIPALLRMIGLVLLEFVMGLSDLAAGVLQGRNPPREAGALVSRIFAGIGLREVATLGAKTDLVRGLPIVHVNFLGYDELSHRRGPDSAFAHWSLRGIDNAVRALTIEAHRSRRRDYHVWVFSDHGQERSRSYASFPGEIEGIVSDCLEVVGNAGRRRPPARPIMRPDVLAKEIFSPEKPYALTAMGPVGHLYLAEPMDDDRKAALARRLVEKKLPGILRLSSDGSVTWHHSSGESVLPLDQPPALSRHPEALRRELIGDLIRLCRSENAGDLILLGWQGDEGSCTFAPERGSHAGPGLDEIQGFLLVPPATWLPAEASDFVRPSTLRTAAMALLGRQPVPRIAAAVPAPPERLTVMSYNVHSCIGMDGRVSPRRIARVIARQGVDIVALQEIDHGRARSRAEDQAGDIAAELGFHLLFCPAVVRGDERYGHALLSRWPLEAVKIDLLPSHPGGVWPEPRAGLWARVHAQGATLNVLSTHLGLAAPERIKQMTAILGPDWLGPVLDREPVILCGDFNLTPGSAAHRLAASRLRDVAHHFKRGVRTFSSMRLVAQLDHIFVSPHFALETVFAAQNDLTRVASDHLPLVAHLRMPGR